MGKAVRARVQNFAWKSGRVVLMFFIVGAGLFRSEAQQPTKSSSQTAGAEVVAAEVEFQRYENTFNGAALKKVMAPDAIEVQDEIMNRDRVIAILNGFRGFPCHLSPVKMENTDVTMLSKSVATILYQASEVLTCGRKSLTIQGNAAGVWVRKDGHWQAQIHTETVDWSKLQVQR